MLNLNQTKVTHRTHGIFHAHSGLRLRWPVTFSKRFPWEDEEGLLVTIRVRLPVYRSRYSHRAGVLPAHCARCQLERQGAIALREGGREGHTC